MLSALNEITKTEIISHALEHYPKEACGLILNISGKPQYRPCKNIAESQTDFILDPEDYIRCEDEGDIIAVVHSHCNVSPKPSQADLVSCEISGLPWIIVSVPEKVWHYFEPSGFKAPLIGRVFSHGVLDCYSTIRDGMREKFGVEIPDFERGEYWWEKGGNLYLDNFQSAGFTQIIDGSLNEGDVLLMMVGKTKVPNHGALYLGKNTILHHVQNRLSCRDVYGGYWMKHTTHVLRHKQLL